MNLIPVSLKTLASWVCRFFCHRFGVDFDLADIDLEERELTEQLRYGRD
jgi:hypothetical protein